MPRPLIQKGVGELEALFVEAKTDSKVLKQLEHELQYRQVPRAVALLAKVRAAARSEMPVTPAVSTVRAAPAPQQSALRERSAAHGGAEVFPTEIQPCSTSPGNPVDAPVSAEPNHPRGPTVPLDDAYKLLKATPGTTWESIEETRRQLVQQFEPGRLKAMSPERRAQALAEVAQVNAAYAALSEARWRGR
jgi:hypothetical protein